MDFEPHNFPALVASVIRSDPALAEPLKEIFAAYARNEDLDERWAQIDVKFHQSLRLILEDLNEIDDPVSLDQEIQVLLQAIDQAHLRVEEEAADAPAAKKKTGKAKKKAAGVKKKASKPAKKKAGGAKKKAGGVKKKATKTVKKKAAKPAKKKAAGAKKKTAKPAKKKAAGVKKKASKPVKKKAAGAKKKAAKPAKKKKKK